MKEIEGMFKNSSETERLALRPLRVNDYENWLDGFNGRNPSQNCHDQGKMDMSECTLDWFRDLVAKHQRLATADDTYIFGVFRKEDRTHIGMIDFSTLARDNFKWGRAGYFIHNQFWRKGYGKEALKEALAIAFYQLDFHRIEAHINLDNIPSIKLAESAGMEFECLRKGFIFENEEWTDHLVYYANSQVQNKYLVRC